MSWHGVCDTCGKRAELAYEPGGNPPKRICAICFIRWRTKKKARA